jgi:hypothetical protein
MGRNIEYILHVKGADEKNLKRMAEKVDLMYKQGSSEKIIGLERISRLIYLSKSFKGWYKVNGDGKARKTKNKRAGVYKNIYSKKIIKSVIYVPEVLSIIKLNENRTLDSEKNEAILIAKNNKHQKDFVLRILREKGFLRERYYIERLVSVLD